MKRKGRKQFILGVSFITFFVIWTMLIRCVDVQAIGPNKSQVGFATLNSWFHHMTGTHRMLYEITDWMGLVPILICMIFGLVGLAQFCKRKSLRKVDKDILTLGLYYVVVIGFYLLFEIYPVNYRPVLIEGSLEASYPSSTTLLVLSVMLSFAERIKRRIGTVFAFSFSTFMILGRLLSGVHWLTDIVGAILLSIGLFSIYKSVNLWNGEL